MGVSSLSIFATSVAMLAASPHAERYKGIVTVNDNSANEECGEDSKIGGASSSWNHRSSHDSVKERAQAPKKQPAKKKRRYILM